MKLRFTIHLLLVLGLIAPLAPTQGLASCAEDFARLSAGPAFPEAIAAKATIATRVPAIVGQISRIATRVNSLRDASPENPDLSARDAAESIFQERISQAQQMGSVAARIDQQYPREKLLSRLLKRLAQHLVPSAQERDAAVRNLQSPSDDTGTHTLGEIRMEENDPRVREELSSITSRVNGDTGELLAAVLLPDAVDVGLHVEEIPRAQSVIDSADLRDAVKDIPEEMDWLDQLANKISIKKIRAKLMTKEIDVVFKQGAAWAEVKNYSYLTDEDLISHQRGNGQFKKKSIYEQALENVLLARLFHKEMHMVFIHGLSKEAACRLAALGIKVHAIYGPPGDLRPTQASADTR